jgi:hypothetical protein
MVNGRERKILQISNQKVIKEWNSTNEVVKHFTEKSLQKSLRNAIKYQKIWQGYFWKYKPEEILQGEFFVNHPYLDIECSNFGRIKLANGQITKGSLNGKKGKYLRVHFKCSRNKFRLVHRLIAETFVPNDENKPTVDHIDRNPLNNNFLNLRWATMKEQSLNKNYYQ